MNLKTAKAIRIDMQIRITKIIHGPFSGDWAK